jgi:hypothetical protein
MFWAAERSFCVDHPVLSEQWSQPRGESLWLIQGRQVSMKSQLAVANGALESGNKLAAKDATEHLDGKKEGIASFDPVRVIGGESAGRNHAMDMRMTSCLSTIRELSRAGPESKCAKAGPLAQQEKSSLTISTLSNLIE